jgi:hypothetical protein
MTTVTIPDFLPQLYVGKHGKDSGRACIMNAFAYMKGDVEISDLPDCVWQPFAKMAQVINDRMCVHLTEEVTDEPIIGVSGVNGAPARTIGFRTVNKLCSHCAHEVWMMGVPLIGTAELANKLTWAQQRKFLLHMGLRLIHQMNSTPGARYSREHYTIIAKIEAIAYGDGKGYMLMDERETEYTRNCSSFFARLALMARLGAKAHEYDEVANLAWEWVNGQGLVNDLGFHSGAYALSRQLTTFVDWLHQAAGQQAPREYTVTEDEVAKIPVTVG